VLLLIHYASAFYLKNIETSSSNMISGNIDHRLYLLSLQIVIEKY